jgi:uncharacterized protein YciI
LTPPSEAIEAHRTPRPRSTPGDHVLVDHRRYLHNVSREGAIMLTGPNPLTEEQSVEVLEQIVLHPLYAEQRISTPDRTDERWVILNEGKITTEDT